MTVITLNNVKSKLRKIGLTVGTDRWIDNLQSRLTKIFGDFSWSYYHEEDTLVISGLPDDVEIPNALYAIGDVVSSGNNIL
jgi:hypothetical protein